ncbi:MAG: hypothetical protein E7218_01605 [Anaerofustis stercorihominis]|nr:hypothetical protein [Anaerofustis stercorihominis]
MENITSELVQAYSFIQTHIKIINLIVLGLLLLFFLSNILFMLIDRYKDSIGKTDTLPGQLDQRKYQKPALKYAVIGLCIHIPQMFIGVFLPFPLRLIWLAAACVPVLICIFIHMFLMGPAQLY